MLFVAPFAACASLAPVTWPTPPPHLVTLKLTGGAARPEKLERCERVARELGATPTEPAPIIATLTLVDDGNRLTISAADGRVLRDEPRPGDSVGDLCADAIAKVAALMPRSVSAAEVVNGRVMANDAFKDLAEAASRAQEAHQITDETPIEEMEEGSDQEAALLKALNAAHDAYRRYDAWGSDKKWHSSRFDLGGTTVSDVDASGVAQVPIKGRHVFVRVRAVSGALVVEAILSSKGKEIVNFDGAMNEAVTPSYRSYMVGDKIDVGGAIRKRLRRGKADAVGVAPTAAPATAAGGCTKDVDCKGDRICVGGACVNPR